MLEGRSTCIIGVSGGADSMCLLDVLYSLYGDKIRLSVIHVHHGLRENADMEAEYVRKYCDTIKVSCKVVKVDVKSKAEAEGLSTEEAARILRYEAFAKETGDDDDAVVAVAHNMDDQAETMLHNLFRGSSLNGLCGIKPVRNNIIRPLLCVSRKEIEDYLSERNIKYCTDESNLTDDYTRNKLRHNILSYVTENINGGALRNMFSVSEDLALAHDYLKGEADRAYDDTVLKSPSGLEIIMDKYELLHPYIQSSLLYKAFGEMSGALKDVEKKHIRIIADLFNKQVGRVADLPYGIRAKRTYGGVSLRHMDQVTEGLSPAVVMTAPGVYDFDGKQVILELTGAENISDTGRFNIDTNSSTKWFDYDKIDMLCVRYPDAGDYIIISEKGDKKDLGKYFKDEKVPGEDRKRIPVICDGHSVIYIYGMRDGAGARIDKDTKNILKITVQ